MERASWRLAGTRARGALSLSCTGVGFAPFPLRIFAESFDNAGSAPEDSAESHRETLDKRTKPSEVEEISFHPFAGEDLTCAGRKKAITEYEICMHN